MQKPILIEISFVTKRQRKAKIITYFISNKYYSQLFVSFKKFKHWLMLRKIILLNICKNMAEFLSPEVLQLFQSYGMWNFLICLQSKGNR